MTRETEQAFSAMTQLNMWFKVSGGEPLTLTDIPELIKNRWPYFRDNWDNILQSYIDRVDTYINPHLLTDQIVDFSNYILSHRNYPNNTNPFSKTDTLYKFYSIFDVTLVSDIPLTNEENTTINNHTTEVQRYSRNDFLELRAEIIKERDLLADKVGHTDPDYNEIMERSPIATQVSIRNADVNVMYEYQQGIKAIDFILSNIFSLDTAFIDPFALAKANANNPDININTYSSGTLVRLNYKEDLRQLAARTMGDEEKWIEIAIANGLKPPYIDEIGEKIELIANANDNQINIAGTDAGGNLNLDKLYVNQIVLLQSNVLKYPEQRTIINIRQVPVSREIVIELSGDLDLNKYKLSEGAYIRIFKPNTINSNFFILIPSDEQLENTRKDEIPWFLKSSSESEKRQKIDLFLNDSNDIEFGSTNDLILSYGLSNAIQAIKLKFMISAGELIRHRDYGFINVKGNTNVDVSNIKRAVIDSIESNIAADDRFDGINKLDVLYNGNTISVFLTVKLAGSTQTIPITFTVNIR